jgi:hypothetical protein
VNSGPSPRAQLVVAVFLLIAFGVVVALMLGWADTWDQRVYVFGAVEAIVFTAVGWIFGREVHRQTAEVAQKDAAEAKAEVKSKAEEVTKLAEEAQKGRALKAAIEAVPVEAPSSAGGPRDVSALPSPAAPQGSLAHLRSMAEKLYE